VLGVKAQLEVEALGVAAGDGQLRVPPRPRVFFNAEAAEPPKPPKPLSQNEITRKQKDDLQLTPEETERLEAYRQRKNGQIRKWREKTKAALPMAANQ
jgi:hypothetical protein